MAFLLGHADTVAAAVIAIQWMPFFGGRLPRIVSELPVYVHNPNSAHSHTVQSWHSMFLETAEALS